MSGLERATHSQTPESLGLDVSLMHKHISAAIVRDNKSKSLDCVEPLDSTSAGLQSAASSGIAPCHEGGGECTSRGGEGEQAEDLHD